jgi:hypothetical protein
MSGIAPRAHAGVESGRGARSDTESGAESARTGAGPSDGQAGMSTSPPTFIRLSIE